VSRVCAPTLPLTNKCYHKNTPNVPCPPQSSNRTLSPFGLEPQFNRSDSNKKCDYDQSVGKFVIQCAACKTQLHFISKCYHKNTPNVPCPPQSSNRMLSPFGLEPQFNRSDSIIPTIYWVIIIVDSTVVGIHS
jgi:hypothetical protein